MRYAILSLGSGGEAQRIRGHPVTGSYFETPGATPAAGRLLGAADAYPDSNNRLATVSSAESIVAPWLPARRAACLDPVFAHRTE